MDKDGNLTLVDVTRAIKKLDDKRKNDLLHSLVSEMFDDFFRDGDAKIESMIEVIENITGLDNVESLLYQ